VGARHPPEVAALREVLREVGRCSSQGLFSGALLSAFEQHLDLGGVGNVERKKKIVSE
jgi:hypothetical protein